MGLPIPATNKGMFNIATDGIMSLVGFRGDYEAFGIGWADVMDSGEELHMLDVKFLYYSFAGEDIRVWAILWSFLQQRLLRNGFAELNALETGLLDRQFRFLEGDDQYGAVYNAVDALGRYDYVGAPDGYQRVPIVAAVIPGEDHDNHAIRVLNDCVDHQRRMDKLGDLPQRIAEIKHDDPEIRSPASQQTIVDGIDAMNSGLVRATEILNGERSVQPWVKELVLLLFRRDNELMQVDGVPAWDKVPWRHQKWGAEEFSNARIRVMPGCKIRTCSFIGPGTICMGGTSINSGAYIGNGVMMDRDSGAGACSVIMDDVHMGGDAATGGVLSPAEATGVVIDRGAFIGPQSEVYSGAWVKPHAVLTAGTCVGGGSRIYDRTVDEYLAELGEVPAGAVVAMGVVNEPDASVSLVRPIVVKYRDLRTSAALVEEEVLRG